MVEAGNKIGVDVSSDGRRLSASEKMSHICLRMVVLLVHIVRGWLI